MCNTEGGERARSKRKEVREREQTGGERVRDDR